MAARELAKCSHQSDISHKFCQFAAKKGIIPSVCVRLQESKYVFGAAASLRVRARLFTSWRQ
jgi:hypothetical protein